MADLLDDYGWSKTELDPNAAYLNQPSFDGGGVSQPGSQTAGQGAGITPTTIKPPDTTQGAGAAGTPTATTMSSPLQDARAAQAAGSTATAQSGQGQTGTAPDTGQWDSMVQDIQNASDPQQQALAHDTLARNLYSSLQEQGHDVKWDGDNLIVDGRPYVVGGAPTSTAGPVAKTGGEQAPAATAPQAGMWAPTNQGFLDWATKTYGSDPRGPGFVNAAAGGGLQQMLARYTQETGNQATYIGGPSGDRVDFGQGVQDALTSGGQIWNAAGGGGGAAGAGGGGAWGGGMPPGGAVQAPGMTTQYDEALKAAMTRQGDFSVPDVRPGQLDDAMASWRPGTGPTYTPGEIGFGDIPDFTYESLLGDMGKGTEGFESLFQNLMAHPESLDEHTVDTMKSQMKSTLAEQQQQEEEDLKGFGAASGIGDSGWLAAQRAGSRRSRDMGVAAGAQNIDIEAAKTRMGDRRAAAELGIKYAAGKSANVQAASDAALKKAAVTGDRLALRESVKQQAAKLGIEADQVMSSFIGNQQDNLMKKYGIDLGAAIDMKKLGEQSQQFKEDLVQKMAALERSLSMQKYGIDTGAASSKYGVDVGSATSRYGVDVGADTADKSRRQQDEQFAASLGLSYEQFNQAMKNDEWGRFKDLYGTAGGA